jgi:uncharacterized protein
VELLVVGAAALARHPPDDRRGSHAAAVARGVARSVAVVRRSWVVLVAVVASSCGDGTPADVATDPIDTAARSAPPTGTAASPVSASSGIEPSVVPGVVPGVVPEGFGTIAARVTASDGEVCQLCLWLADDDAARGRGLMQVTDLDGLDGMAFRYDAPHTTSFTMRNTVMPLSIAFFGLDGVHLDAFDMQPCVAEPCPSYPTPNDFLVALEVPQGGLPELGIGAGSLLELLAEGCRSAAPPTT